MKGKFLKSKEVKEVHKLLNEQFGYENKLEYYFYKTEKDRVYIVNREVSDVLDEIKINSLGLYFATITKDNKLRLTVEGSQIVGPEATKNVIEIDEDKMFQWFKGEDLIMQGTEGEFVILKFEKDYLGCGKVRDGNILSFLPKTRRLVEINYSKSCLLQNE